MHRTMPRIHRLAPRLGLLLLLPWLSGCFAFGATIRELRVEKQSADDIFRAIVKFANIQGFRGDPEESDVTKRLYVSRWRGGGGPIIGRDGGKRTRFYGEVVRPREGEGWMVLFYFEQQRIGEVGRGLNPADDDWDAAGQDVNLERIFVRNMSITFPGPGFGAGGGTGVGTRVGTRVGTGVENRPRDDR